MFRTVFSALAIAAFLFSASCGEKAGGKGDKGDKAGKTDKAGQSGKGDQSKGGETGSKADAVSNEGAESPEKAFEGFKAATESKGTNFSKALSFVAPDERMALAVVIHMNADETASMSDNDKAADEYKAITTKYKVTVKPEGLEEHEIAEAMDSFPKMIALGKRMMKGVDVAGYIREAEAFINKNQSDSEKETISDLKDVKIEGDKASGKVKAGEEERPVNFKKVSGRWFVSIETLVN